MRLDLVPGDILLTSPPSLLGRLIRWAERCPGEDDSRASHAGVIVAGGAWDAALVSEAIRGGVRVRTLRPYVKAGTPVRIVRPLNIPVEHLDQIVQGAWIVSDEGTRYAYGQLVLHFGDFLLSKLRRREVVFFRRRIDSETFTTCARHVAQVYALAGYDFGVPTDLCTPDHIDDFATANPGKYLEVWPWGPLPGRTA